MTNLEQELKHEAFSQGATLYGVADLTEVKDYLHKSFGKEIAVFPRAVSVGVAFPSELVNPLREAPSHTYLYYYNVINSRLDSIALSLCLILQEKGFRCLPVPASQRVSDDRLAGIFPHRLAARLAGLGWIGKNASLINRNYGPRVRLVTVLTDYELKSDVPVKERCGSCQACVKACPPEALTGVPFSGNEQLEKRFIGERCDEHLSKVRSVFGKRICGKCLAVCPWGERKVKYEQQKKE